MSLITLLVVAAPLLLAAGPASSGVVPRPVLTSFRSQDELGGYHFGYSGGPTSRAEQRDHLGVVRGAYNYITDDGTVHKYEYISDADGYRLTSGTGLPVAPVHTYVLPVAPVAPVFAPVVPALVAPKPVQETPEVRQAREKFEATFRAAVAKLPSKVVR